MGLAAIASHRLAGVIPVGAIFQASLRIGGLRTKASAQPTPAEEPLRVLQ